MSTRRSLPVVLVLGLVLRPGVALAHGLELERSDPPIPVVVFLVAAATVLVVSFVGVNRLWKRPRLQDGPRARPFDRPLVNGAVSTARWAGLVALAVVLFTGLGAGDAGVGGLSPILVWIIFWLVVPFASVVLGDVWTPLNPWRRLGELLGLGQRERPELLAKWGVYPAAGVFGVFSWFELVYPESASGWALGVAATVYTVAMAAAMVVAGRSTGLQITEPFTTFNRAMSGIAPFGRAPSGEPLNRGWLRALPVLPEWRGVSLFVVLMIATVTFDGLADTLWWRDTLAAAGINASSVWVGTVGLAAMAALIGSGYWLACSFAALAVRNPRYSTGAVAASFAHTLVPIAAAYAVAHYFTLVLFEGQLLFVAVSDPLGRGWDLLGTAGWQVQVWLPDGVIWWTQVAVILTGHVIAVILAHDRALSVFPTGAARSSQYAMILIMIVLTMLGLSLLAAG